jgi:hypothetical protein
MNPIPRSTLTSVVFALAQVTGSEAVEDEVFELQDFAKKLAAVLTDDQVKEVAAHYPAFFGPTPASDFLKAITITLSPELQELDTLIDTLTYLEVMTHQDGFEAKVLQVGPYCDRETTPEARMAAFTAQLEVAKGVMEARNDIFLAGGNARPKIHYNDIPGTLKAVLATYEESFENGDPIKVSEELLAEVSLHGWTFGCDLSGHPTDWQRHQPVNTTL